MRCAYHPNTETDLTCGRCNAPICPRCLIHTEVGIRCPKCCQASHKPRRLVGTLLAFGVVAVFACVLALPPLLGLKPRVPSSGSPTAAALPPVAVMPTFPPAPPTPSYDLAIVSSSCLIGQHSTKCTGSVRNVSAHTLQHVQVVVEMATEDLTPQSSDYGPIDYDPLLPDQESPWTLYPSFNPALTQYFLTFRTVAGQPLRSRKETP
jgi:hypothetical protein